MEPSLLLLLGVGAFLAGLVDAVVGGGGLIQLPLLMAVFPGAPVALLFGTNKLSSIAGTASAVWHYSRHLDINTHVVLPGAAAALVGAWLGASVVSAFPSNWMRPLVLVLLVLVLAYTWMRPSLGKVAGVAPPQRIAVVLAASIGAVLGFYDGFFGPGTGSFLILAFVRLLGMELLQASASAKVLNLATNLAALSYFAATDSVMWGVGLMMAVCNIGGAQVGARMALKHGHGFIRVLFLVVVAALIGKLSYDVMV